MNSSLSSLLELAATLAGRPLQETEQLAEAMLVSLQPGQWRSTLNNDGSPLQISISLSGGAQPAIRLLADPAAKTASVDERSQNVGRALDAVLNSHAPEMQSLCNSVLDNMLPQDISARAALPGGGAWLAAGLSEPGMACYVTTKWCDDKSRWTHAQRWLGNLLPHGGAESSAVIDRMSSHASLVSAGVEGVSSKRARAKFYWRLNGAASLRDIDLPLMDAPEIADFLVSVIENRHIPRAAVVGSVSFELAGGTLSDVKLDVCGHCVPRPWPQWMPILQNCVSRFGLTGWPIDPSDMWQKSELAFLGFGLDQARKPRLNVYLKGISC